MTCGLRQVKRCGSVVTSRWRHGGSISGRGEGDGGGPALAADVIARAGLERQDVGAEAVPGLAGGIVVDRIVGAVVLGQPKLVDAAQAAAELPQVDGQVDRRALAA